MNGKEVTTSVVIEQACTIIIFLAPGCDPCADAIERWKKYKDQLPRGFQVIGICETDYETGQAYISESGFPYAAYFDTGYVFANVYDVYQFPNVMGVFPDQRISFLNRGLYNDFSPLDASKLFLGE